MEEILNLLEKFNTESINITINENEGVIEIRVELDKESKSDYDLLKEKIDLYKAKIEKLDDCLFEKVLDEAEKRNFNLYEMNKGLELDSYTEKDVIYANNVMFIMEELIKEVVGSEINKLTDVLKSF